MRNLIWLVLAGAATIGFSSSSLLAAEEAWQTEWKSTIQKAKGQTLALTIHTQDGYADVVDEFRKEFPDINVQTNLASAAPTAARIVTEQKNGIYAWDSWWAPIANMTSTLLPAGAMAPITDYLILPEVKDLSNWNAPEYIYAVPGNYIFVHTYQQEMSVYQNVAIKGSKLITKPEDLLNPVFKGQIATREPSALNAGTLALSGLLRENDLRFIQRLFNEQEPVIIDNPRQLIDSVIRGDKMVVIGGSSDIFSQCATAGACNDIKALPMGRYVTSRGVTVLKNAPHKEATKVWINWLLSKKGQETWVRIWAKSNDSAGAISLRKDVAPDPKHVGSIPDYGTLGKYTLNADESGRVFTEQVVNTYNAYKTRPR